MTKGYTIRDRQFWVIVLSLGLASMFIFAAMYSLQPLIPLFTSEFNISISSASLSMSLTTVSLIAGLIVLGFFSDRNGRVLFIKLSIFLSLILFLLIPYTDSFFIILILRFIQGFTLAGVPAAAIAYIGEEIDSQYSALATSLYISCNALGGMIGRIVTAYVSEQYSWQLAFILLCIFGTVILIIVLFALPKSRNFVRSERLLREDFKSFLFHLKNPKLLLLFGLGIILQVSFTGVWTYIPFYLINPPFSLTLDSISLLYFAYGIGILGAPIASWLSNHLGVAKVRAIAIFIMIAGILATLSTSLGVVIFGLCILCFGFFTSHSLAAATVSRTATHQKGSASSLYLVSYYLGVACGSTLLSSLWSTESWLVLASFTASLPLLYLIFLTYQFKKVN
ncbi:MFS transporter [Solibacillus sp. FSL H8-0538]|uniref:MFS transporter n=1 Tax=Solibacillus sp. FSL H8-0538 TaxID=2921400 RepID=UPI0030F5F828